MPSQTGQKTVDDSRIPILAPTAPAANDVDVAARRLDEDGFLDDGLVMAS